MKLDLNDIRTDGGTQPRAAINWEAVAEYAEALAGGAVFPPVTVFHDGKVHWLADGFHRYHAHAKSGAAEIECDVRQGSQDDAILFSVGANAGHGLRRTPEDKHRAVRRLLDDITWSLWSDREIARRCGVSQPFVSKLRPRRHLITLSDGDAAPAISSESDGGDNPVPAPQASHLITLSDGDAGLTVPNAAPSTMRTAQRGDSVYTMNVSNIGRSKPQAAAAEGMPELPAFLDRTQPPETQPPETRPVETRPVETQPPQSPPVPAPRPDPFAYLSEPDRTDGREVIQALRLLADINVPCAVHAVLAIDDDDLPVAVAQEAARSATGFINLYRIRYAATRGAAPEAIATEAAG